MKKRYALFALVAISSFAANSTCVNIGARGFKGTFEGKNSITNVEFFSCRNIGESAFEGAFVGCTGLRTVRFNECTNVSTSAFLGAFKGCSGIEKIEFEKLENADDSSFKDSFSDGCGEITLELPSLKNVKALAFNGCHSITSFVADALESYGNVFPMFDGCYGLKNVSVKSLGSLRYDEFTSATNVERVAIGLTTNELNTTPEYPWGLATNTLVICKGGNEIRVPSANWKVVAKTEGVEIHGTPSYIGDPFMPHGWGVGFTYNGTYGVAYAYGTYYNDDEITLTDYSFPVEIEISCQRIR